MLSDDKWQSMRTAIHLNQSNELWFMGAHQNTGDTLNYVSSTTITDGQPGALLIQY